jgi:hypothetical protein
MSVSEAVRAAMKKGKLSQTELGRRWGRSPQAINNKLRQYPWTGEELAQVAAYTGGTLAFIYPDGEQIRIDVPAEFRKKKKAAAPAKTKQPKTAKASVQAKAAKSPVQTKAPEAPKMKEPAKPKQAKAPSGPKKPKAPKVQEVQISIFDL